jgi:bifunctional DNA-binding transcriptional regulator/antitoxin component of YhaV-PrlF toxin-antitoxin module
LSDKTRQMPTVSEVVSVDENLRIKFPESVSKALEITPDTKLLLMADPTVGEIIMNVAARPGAPLAEARMIIGNQPGSLTKIGGKLAEDQINIVMFLMPPSTMDTINGTMLLDVSKSKKTAREIETSLSELDVIRKVTVKLV